jgi:hypothetical protein
MAKFILPNTFALACSTYYFGEKKKLARLFYQRNSAYAGSGSAVITQMKKEKNRKRDSLRCDKKVWDMG